MTASEVMSAQRIYNYVNNFIGHYYGGDKTQEQVEEFISNNRWIMFPSNFVTSLKEGAGFPAPNVYVGYGADGTIVDNNCVPVAASLGLTFNNNGAMDWLKVLLRRHPAFLDMVHALGDDWVVSIQHKIKTSFIDNTPIYREIFSLKTSVVTANEIREAIEAATRTLPVRNDYFEDERVLNSITVFVLDKEIDSANEIEYKKDLKEVFELLMYALTHN